MPQQPDAVITAGMVTGWAGLIGATNDDAAIDLGVALDEVANSIPVQYSVSVSDTSTDVKRHRNRAKAILALMDMIAG